MGSPAPRAPQGSGSRCTPPLREAELSRTNRHPDSERVRTTLCLPLPKPSGVRLQGHRSGAGSCHPRTDPARCWQPAWLRAVPASRLRALVPGVPRCAGGAPLSCPGRALEGAAAVGNSLRGPRGASSVAMVLAHGAVLAVLALQREAGRDGSRQGTDRQAGSQAGSCAGGWAWGAQWDTWGQEPPCASRALCHPHTPLLGTCVGQAGPCPPGWAVLGHAVLCQMCHAVPHHAGPCSCSQLCDSLRCLHPPPPL